MEEVYTYYQEILQPIYAIYQGNVKVGTKLLLLGDSENLKIRNANIEIRNNIKIQISNDRNIPDTYATSIGP